LSTASICLFMQLLWEWMESVDRWCRNTDRGRQNFSKEKKSIPVPLYLPKTHVDWRWTWTRSFGMERQ
jgi:hypothetical protein